jgi:hypothetical protein
MSVYCACGAEWHGQWVTKAEAVIVAHKERWSDNRAGCGPITEAEWGRRFIRVKRKPVACPRCGHLIDRRLACEVIETTLGERT